MNLETFKIIEIVLALLLVLLITIQTKSNSLSESVSSAFTFNRTKRGVEMIIFYLTIILIIAFSFNTLFLLLNK
jgi:preprotein translocase subunit SecG